MGQDGGWLVVTPARNEAAQLPQTAQALAAQGPGAIALWVVVDDGSDDGTGTCLQHLSLPFPVDVLRRENTGGLGGASEWTAFLAGVERGLAAVPDPPRVMKLDADISLDPGYFAALRDVPPGVGLTGGRLRGMAEREQRGHVRGALKAYTPQAFRVVEQLPAALGWDVLDAVALRRQGWQVEVVEHATATTTRRTGSSEGLRAGRRRGGVVSRWTGYHPVYFLARLVRYCLRRPYGAGAAAMLWGWLRAGPGPWPVELKRAMRAEQTVRLRALARSPIPWLRATYGTGSDRAASNDA